MAESPNLTPEQLSSTRDVLELVRRRLIEIAEGDPKRLHHARRYLQKRLEFDERGTPADRTKLKLTLIATQQGKCAACGEPLPPRDAELDRTDPVLGYTEGNCRLNCEVGLLVCAPEKMARSNNIFCRGSPFSSVRFGGHESRNSAEIGEFSLDCREFGPPILELTGKDDEMQFPVEAEEQGISYS